MDKQEALENGKKNRRFGAAFQNILSMFLLITIVLVLGISLVIFFNPHSALNPFPPPLVLAAQPTQGFEQSNPHTATVPPTETYTPVPTLTPTLRSTSTLPPSPTPFILYTLSPTPEPTDPPEGYPFILQENGAIVIANISHPDLGCNWMGVAGQVFDLSGGPVTGLLIRLGGEIPKVDIPSEMLSLTGAALNYGRVGYYEFTLADQPVASEQSVWVQLVDQENIPLSEKIYFDTYDTCDKNLIIINFKQVR